MKHKKYRLVHVAIWMFIIPTLIPFYFVINNSMRSNMEMYRSYFGFPKAITRTVSCGWNHIIGKQGTTPIINDDKETVQMTYKDARNYYFNEGAENYVRAWVVLKVFILNTLRVVFFTALGVLFFGSITAYILSRFRFPGKKVIFYYFVCTMMFPAVLTLVPSFLIIKELGLLNSYWALILPGIAGGQVFAIFVFKSFFDGLPQDLFDSAKIDGAGHISLYWNLILPLSKPVLSVVLIMNILGTWNSFLWPFIVNTDSKYHVIASGLYIFAQSEGAGNMGMVFAAYVLSSIPLLILFVYATKLFMKGMTSGAFKA